MKMYCFAVLTKLKSKKMERSSLLLNQNVQSKAKTSNRQHKQNTALTLKIVVGSSLRLTRVITLPESSSTSKILAG